MLFIYCEYTSRIIIHVLSSSLIKPRFGELKSALTDADTAKNIAKVQIVGIELTNGEKFQLADSPKDKAWLCFILYAKERGIFEEDLGF